MCMKKHTFTHIRCITFRESDNSNTYGEKLKVFANNLNIVQELNKLEKGSAIYGITKFMDYSG